MVSEKIFTENLFLYLAVQIQSSEICSGDKSRCFIKPCKCVSNIRQAKGWDSICSVWGRGQVFHQSDRGRFGRGGPGFSGWWRSHPQAPSAVLLKKQSGQARRGVWNKGVLCNCGKIVRINGWFGCINKSQVALLTNLHL